MWHSPSSDQPQETTGNVTTPTPKRGLGAWWRGIRKGKPEPNISATTVSDTEQKGEKWGDPTTFVKPTILPGPSSTVWNQSARSFLSDNLPLEPGDLVWLPVKDRVQFNAICTGWGVVPRVAVAKMITFFGEQYVTTKTVGAVVMFYLHNFVMPTE